VGGGSNGFDIPTMANTGGVAQAQSHWPSSQQSAGVGWSAVAGVDAAFAVS